MKTTFRYLLVSAALLAGAGLASAQTYQALNLSSNTIPALATNSVAGTSVQNGYIKKADLYYSFQAYSTNGNVTIPIQTSPDNSTWAQVPSVYLATGTTNQINVPLSTVLPASNTFSGVITVDLSHGQYFRAGSEVNTGSASSSGTGGVTNLTVNYLLPQN